jgi:hypothetical protein
LSTSGGRSVGIVRLRTKGHGVCLFLVRLQTPNKDFVFYARLWKTFGLIIESAFMVEVLCPLGCFHGGINLKIPCGTLHRVALVTTHTTETQLWIPITPRNPEDGGDMFSEASVRTRTTRYKVPEGIYNFGLQSTSSYHKQAGVLSHGLHYPLLISGFQRRMFPFLRVSNFHRPHLTAYTTLSELSICRLSLD